MFVAGLKTLQRQDARPKEYFSKQAVLLLPLQKISIIEDAESRYVCQEMRLNLGRIAFSKISLISQDDIRAVYSLQHNCIRARCLETGRPHATEVNEYFICDQVFPYQ